MATALTTCQPDLVTGAVDHSNSLLSGEAAAPEFTDERAGLSIVWGSTRGVRNHLPGKAARPGAAPLPGGGAALPWDASLATASTRVVPTYPGGPQ